MWASHDLGSSGLVQGQFDFIKGAPPSPESLSKSSFGTDLLDNLSDEDFLTQLSNELDIPLLLNPEDDHGILNSYLDKSPDEILSEMSSPSHSSIHDMSELPIDFLNYEVDLNSPKKEVISDDSSSNGSPRSLSRGSVSPVKSESPPKMLSVKCESPPRIISNNFTPNNAKRPAARNLQEMPKKLAKTALKTETKTVPIQPKIKTQVLSPTITPVVSNFSGNSVVFIKNELPTTNLVTNPQKVVVLTTQTVVPVINTATNTISQIKDSPSVVIKSAPVSPPTGYKNPHLINLKMARSNIIDPQTFKKQQRKIKNRESASMSRKKKKDYLNSLEEKVQELTTENDRLNVENAALKERLSLYENVSFDKNFSGIQGKNAKLALCIFLLVVGFNLDFLRSPLSVRMDIRNIKSIEKVPLHQSRSLLWAVDDGGGESIKNNTEEVRRNSSINYFTMCPVFINQTESARLVLELEKWIGKPMGAPPPKFEPPSMTEEKQHNIKKHKKKRDKVKIRIEDSPIASLGNYGPANQHRNEIQVFSPSAEQMYTEFFEAINRRDDTFYVVSFNEHHMLLPALYHNKTRRPKMSFLMPNPMINDTSAPNLMPLMQIDCEVLDTKLVNVKYGSIPTEYRSGNVTKPKSAQNVKNDRSNDAGHYDKKVYKPYFLYKKLSKSNEGIGGRKYDNLSRQNLDLVKP